MISGVRSVVSRWLGGPLVVCRACPGAGGGFHDSGSFQTSLPVGLGSVAPNLPRAGAWISRGRPDLSVSVLEEPVRVRCPRTKIQSLITAVVPRGGGVVLGDAAATLAPNTASSWRCKSP